jgi:transcription elongation factor Elf1
VIRGGLNAIHPEEMPMVIEKFTCPACGETASMDANDLTDNPATVECESCGASLEVPYSVTGISIDEGGVEISRVPAVNFDCPECGSDLEINDITTEEGSESVECDSCKSTIDVKWSDWGKQTVTTAIWK